MHLTPSFDNTFPMDAASELVSNILNGFPDKKESAQAVCCLLCYGTNFIPTGKVYTGGMPATAIECGQEIINILQPITAASSTTTKTTAAAAIPWAKLLALLVQLLSLLGTP